MIRHVLTRVVLLVLAVPATFAGCGSDGDRFSSMGTIRIHVLTSALVGSTP